MDKKPKNLNKDIGPNIIEDKREKGNIIERLIYWVWSDTTDTTEDWLGDD